MISDQRQTPINLLAYFIRALALKNANAISKENLAFAALKSSASKNCKGKYCKFFLQYCYSAILKVELHCSSIVKKKKKKIISHKIIFYLSLSHLSHLSSLSHFTSLSLIPTLYLRLPLPVSPPSNREATRSKYPFPS